MATMLGPNILKSKFQPQLYNAVFQFQNRMIQTTSVCEKAQAGRHKATPNKNKPLTYEMAFKPHHIGVKKAWNSWNTSTIYGGSRKSETAVEDMFIRKFITGTFATCVLSEIIIKRNYNMTRIGAIIHGKMAQEKLMFLIGYAEEFLGYWIQGPVKLEVQIAVDPKALVFKYV